MAARLRSHSSLNVIDRCVNDPGSSNFWFGTEPFPNTGLNIGTICEGRYLASRMLQSAIHSAVECLSGEDIKGPRGHAQGSTNVSLISRITHFEASLKAASDIAAKVDAANPKQVSDALSSTALSAVTQNLTELRAWCKRSPTASLALFRRALQASGLQYSEDEDRVSALSESLLIDVTKSTFEAQVRVFEGEDSLKAELKVEAIELSQAIRQGNMDELIVVVQGIVLRAKNLLRQIHLIAPPSGNIQDGWGGSRGVPLKVFGETNKLAHLFPSCHLYYEVLESEPHKTRYHVTINPPIAMLPSVASRVTKGDFSVVETPMGELAPLIRTLLTEDRLSSIIDFSTAATGASVGLYSLAQKPSNELASSTRLLKAPIVARFESYNMGELEVVSGSIVRKQFYFNHLILSCFEKNSAKGPVAMDADPLLYTAKIDAYPRGLQCIVQAHGIVLTVLFDISCLAVEEVEVNEKDDRIEINESLTDLATNMTELLVQTFSVPATLHYCIYCLLRPQGSRTKRTRIS